MQEIELTQGKYALVDDEDYDRVNQHIWHAYESGNTWYARNKSLGHMHSFILVVDDGVEVDHKDRNGLNNQKVNLREATRQQNVHNRLMPQTLKGSGYRGVSFKSWGKYCSQIRNPITSRIEHLGSYDTAIEAATAYDRAALTYQGDFAVLNFDRSQYAV